jgi:hypothetical protein
MPGCCFRQVTASRPGSEESLHYCSLPVVSFGRFRDSQGRWHDVEACVSHDGDLTETFPVKMSASPEIPAGLRDDGDSSNRPAAACGTMRTKSRLSRMTQTSEHER